MAAKTALEANSDQPLVNLAFPFPSLIGKLMYCSNCTRPDITTVLNHMSRHMSSPTVSHWAQAKRILKYLNGTRSFCLTFNGSISLDLIMWQDSSFGDGDIKRSRTGFIAMMCGGLVVWGSKLQSTVALSRVEAEYMAISAAVQEVLFLHQLNTNLDHTPASSTRMMEDNIGCMTLATNPMTTRKTKHIDVRYHFIREVVKSKAVILE